MPRILTPVLLSIVSLAACGEPPFTSHERTQLLALTTRPPLPSPTNRFADDVRAGDLGRQLFFDPRLSGPLAIGDDGSNGGLGPAGATGRVACASCHDPARGGADLRSPGGTSLAAGWTGRNAPTVLNVALGAPWSFWDGRKDSLWAQALGPLESPVEHNTSRLEVAHLVFDRYRAPYEALFGALPDLSATGPFPARGRPGDPAWDGLSYEQQHAINEVFANVGKAIEAYERRLTDVGSPFDRFMGGDETAMSDAAVRGARLFVGRAACDECHSGPALADGRFHNHAIPQVGPTVPRVDRGRAGGVEQVMADVFNAHGRYSDGRGAWLDDLQPAERDLGAFKTPTLRNAGKTAPYMHTGSFDTLWDVMVWYRDAAGSDGFVGERDPAVRPLLLNDGELFDLVAFVRALDGDPLPATLTEPPVLP